MSERPVHTEAELVELIRAIDVGAPPQLHGRIEAMVAERAGHSERGWREALGGRRATLGARRATLAGAAVLAAAMVALVVALGAGGPTATPFVREASVLALGRATMAGPHESAQARGRLTASVQGVAFPYWEEAFGWRSVGERSDRLAGRAVTTVFYANGRGQRIGYAIVAGPPPQLHAGAVAWRAHTAYHLLRLGNAEVVAWLRGGRLCVVSGRGVDARTLLRLASWDDGASVAV
jgi:hypothetical protein